MKQLRKFEAEEKKKEEKESFQDFSYRKFTELMDEGTMKELMEDVQNTCREISSNLDASMKSKTYLSASKKERLSKSPCKGSK